MIAERRRRARERTLRRLTRRMEPLMGPDEQGLAAAVLFQRVKPLYPLLLAGLGFGIAEPLWGAGDSAIPTTVSLALGVPLAVAGLGVMSLTGPLILVLSEGTVYVARSNASRLLADAPVGALRVDLDHGRVQIGGLRLWPSPGRRSSLCELAEAADEQQLGAVVIPQSGHRRRRRRILATAGGLVCVLIAVLVAIGIAHGSDDAEIRRTVADYGAAVREGRAADACAALTAGARAEEIATTTAFDIGGRRTTTCAGAVSRQLAGTARGRTAKRNPPLQEVEINGDHARVRVGAPFAYQTIPLEHADRWRIASILGPAVVHDAPADKPPSAPDYAIRIGAVCINSSRRYVPVALRLDNSLGQGGRLTAASVEPLKALVRQDRALAAELMALTPARGARIEVLANALRGRAGVRGRLARAAAGGDPDTLSRATEAMGRAQQATLQAVPRSKLQNSLVGCV